MEARKRVACATFLPVMVPPWNRMRNDLGPALSPAGYRGVSLFGNDRASGPPVRADTHIDPIDWRGSRSLAPEDHLRAMVRNAGDIKGPIGLLTHHIDHDSAIDGFISDLAALLAGHAGARWVSAAHVFGAAR